MTGKVIQTECKGWKSAKWEIHSHFFHYLTPLPTTEYHKWLPKSKLQNDFFIISGIFLH